MPEDPLFVNVDPVTGAAPAYNARELRKALGMLMTQGTHRFGARNGVHPAGSPAVSITGFTVNTQDTKAVVYPALNNQQGPYLVQVPAKAFVVSPNEANPRKDIVVCRVWDDDEDALGLRQADVVYVAGTAAPSPTEPAVPTGAFRMATIDVPATTGNPVLTYNAPYTVALGGILPVRDSSELPVDSLYFGQPVWDQSLKELQVRDASLGWAPVAQVKKAWSTYTPIVTGGGSVTFVGGLTNAGVWKNAGTDTDLVWFNLQLEVSVAGTGSSNVTITAPTSIDRNRRQVITGHLEYAGSDPTTPKLRTVQLVSFTGGSGATFDRTRFETGADSGMANLVGSDLHAGAIIAFSGAYRVS